MRHNAYILMRKNEPVMALFFSEDGHITNYATSFDRKLAPTIFLAGNNMVNDWWNKRAVPIRQGRIKHILENAGYTDTATYLFKNLGLSLTDYYWIKPEKSELRWEDVNLFTNDFRENVLIEPHISLEDMKYSPNSSLQGQIEKTWTIINNERYLIKGNTGNLSDQSINEVVASTIHKLQGYDNYVEYELIKIKGKEYDYGCISKLFTSLEEEFIPAWEIVKSSPKNNSVSLYEHFIRVCGERGIDKDELRRDLEYQLLTDFIISNQDRHLNNFGVLRDADSLKYIRLAPIFDSGNSMFVKQRLDKRLEQNTLNRALNIEINSITRHERTNVALIKDYSVVDLDKLPDRKIVEELYGKDSQISEERICIICDMYEQKIDLCDKLQHGRNPWSEQYSLSDLPPIDRKGKDISEDRANDDPNKDNT